MQHGGALVGFNFERRFVGLQSAGLSRVVVLLTASVLTACAATGTATPESGSGSGFEAFDRELPTSVVLKDLDGKVRSLSEFRGKVVLLDFWATWCRPCGESLAVYDRWQRELGERGLIVVAVSVDEADIDVAGFAKRHCPTAVALRDPGGKLASELGLPTMPTAFLIDRDGRIRYRHVGFDRQKMSALRADLVRVLEAPNPTVAP